MCPQQCVLVYQGLNTITRATSSPWVSLELHVPFEHLFTRRLFSGLLFVTVLLCLCAEAVSVDYKHIGLTFFLLARRSAAV